MTLASIDSYFSIYTAKGTEYIMGNPFRGVLVVGAAGSGKSASVVRQLMYNAVNKSFCGLLYDFKYPTLTNELNGYLYFKQSQARHYNINFTHIEKSVRINPLKSQYVPNSSYAREYAMAIINNLIPESTEKQDFWTRSCIDLLTAEIHYLAQEHPELSSLPHVVALTFTDEDKLIQLLSQNTECLGMIKSLETALRNQAKNQLSGVVSTLQSALSRINTPEIFWVLSGNDISLNINDPQNPIWLSVGNDPGLADTFAPVISLIFTVALKQMNQPNKHKSIVIVDEAPTVFIPNVDRIPATARSNKVSFVFCAQDISQIEKGYGKTNTDVLLSNLNNQFYGRLSSPKSAEHVSKMFGKDDFLYSSESQSTSSGQSFTKGQSKSFSYRERDRVRPQELLNFDPGKFAGFLVESNKKEFIATLKEEMYYIMETPVMHQNCSPKSIFKTIHDQIREIAMKNNNTNFTPQNENMGQQENKGYLSFNA
jgi:type IV secretory pathway TraG/TraD family ATPase VirD4